MLSNRRHARRTTRTYVALLISAATTSGCSIGPWPDSGPNDTDKNHTLPSVERPSHTRYPLTDPTCTGDVAAPHQVIPLDFWPVEALVCGDLQRGSPREDPGRPYSRTVYRGDFTEVVRAFNNEDPHAVVYDGGYGYICTVDTATVAPDPPEVWLIDDTGLGLRPRFPYDSCADNGQSTEGYNLLIQLPVVEQTTVQ